MCVLGCTKEADSSGPVDDSGGSPPESTDDTGSGPSPDPDVPCGEGEPSVVIGTGDEEFVPLTGGDPVTMVHGPQGGWHILGSLRTRHMHPLLDVSYTINSPTHDEIVSLNTYRVLSTEGDDCSATFVGMYGYLIGLPGEFGEAHIPDLLGGLTLEIKMEIRDLNGVELSGTMDVLAELDPIDIVEDTGSR